MTMIGVKSLEFEYRTGGFLLSMPEFAVAKAEKVAVIGPSGSGKTTLLNLVAGILVPQKGSVTVRETVVSDLGDSARRDFRITNVGFVFQDFALLDYLNVMDNILHPYRITGALKLTGQVRKRAEALAREMGIADKLRRQSTDLSHGEKQRAAICRALLPHPEVILADEATGNLDPRNKLRILDLLFESVEKHGATLLAVTHDHELLSRFDRVTDFQKFQTGATRTGRGATEGRAI
jgi:putative ABC transport system ATP-binding protein